MSTSKVVTLLFLLKGITILVVHWIDDHFLEIILAVFILGFILALAYVPQVPTPLREPVTMHKVSRAFPVFDDYMPLPNPKPEDCIIVPLDNPGEKDIVEHPVLTTA